MNADKKILGPDYKAHYHTEDANEMLPPEARPIPDISKIEIDKEKIETLQNHYSSILLDYDHITLRYEDFVPSNETVQTLDGDVKQKLIDYLALPEPHDFYTTLIKTAMFCLVDVKNT